MKLKIIFTSFALCSVFISCTAVAQTTLEDPKTLNINMTATEWVKADIIQFNIVISEEAKTAEEAYRLHKKREQTLLNFLEKYDLDEEDISFEPVTINRRPPNEYQQERSTTRQSVSLNLGDFDIYEELQLGLIEAGFDTFSGRFTSSMISEGKDKALEAAINAAKKRADQIADLSDIALGEIYSISFSDYETGSHEISQERSVMAFSQDAALTDLQQMIPVRATINIQFLIKGKN